MINVGNSSILGNDGNIYLIGGVNEDINKFSESHYKNIY